MSREQFRQLTNEQLIAIDELCTEFEEAWRNGSAPSIESLVESFEGEAQRHLLRELLHTEFEWRLRNDETVLQSEYKDRFPDFASEISSCLASAAESAASQESTQSVLLDETKLFDTEAGRHRRAASDSQTMHIDFDSGQFPIEFGRYTLLKQLGRGGMGSVYLARDQQLDRQVAIKFPEFDQGGDAAEFAIERFYREARSMATVLHSNLCPIYDVGEFDRRHYLTMAYVDGPSLSEASDGLTQEEAIQIVRTISAALQKAHDSGIVHRDLKPSNVMLNSDGEPIVMDFGLASRQSPMEAEITQSGTIIGSPAYMAPEQVEAASDQIGPRTDVYALGVILYQLLTGRRPFEGSGMSVLGQISSGRRPARPSDIADVDQRLESICLKAMAHESSDRFGSAAELAGALAEYQTGQSAVVRRSSKSVVAITAGVIGVAVMLAVALTQLPWDDSEKSISTDAALVGEQSDSPRIDAETVTSQPAPSIGRRFVDSGQELGNGRSRAVRLADFDSDGDLDAFVINRYDQPNRVWINDGTGLFHDSGQKLGNYYSWELAIGDIDGDQDLDAIVVNSKGQDARIWLNDGAGHFAASEHLISGQDAHAIALADFDGDDDLDVMIGDDGANRVWLNDGKGAFEDNGQLLGNSMTRAIGAGDFNGDGFVDIFAGNGGDAQQSNRVWLNDGKAGFSDGGQTLAPTSTIGVVLADLTGNGCLDVLDTSPHRGPNCFWINDGQGQFRRRSGIHSIPAVNASAGDFDDDGDVDLLVSNSQNEPNQIMLNDGHGNFPESEVQWIGHAMSSGSALGDLDGDDDLDAFVTNFRGQPNRVWFNMTNDETLASVWHPAHDPSAQGHGDGTNNGVAMPALSDPAVDKSDLALTAVFDGATSPVTALQFSRDGTALFGGDDHGTVRSWNSRTGEVNYEIPELAPVQTLSISPDGKTIACGTTERGIQLLSADDGHVIEKICNSLLQPLSIDWSPDGRWLLGADFHGHAVVWDLTQRREFKRLVEVGERIATARFSADGSRALVATEKAGMTVWNVPQWQLHSEFSDGYAIAAISPDGGQVTTRGKLFDLEDRRPISTWKAWQFPLQMTFTSDGRHLISNDLYRQLRITRLDQTSGGTIVSTSGRIEMALPAIETFALSPDGRFVATGGGRTFDFDQKNFANSGDYRIRLWRLPREVWPLTSGEK